ncbi:MAG: HipA domain-containing protein [Pseudomonadota bacterium]
MARFDVQRGRRWHVHTLCGLLHADHRLPSLDYVGALTAVHRLTGDHQQLVQMFRRMVFNVLAHNHDDHSKQTSLRMDRRGQWTLAPAYDLTFSEAPGGEHRVAIKGGRDTGT